MNERKQLYRDPVNGRIAGVCAGVAEFFGIEIWLVRILAVTGFFLLAGPFMFVAYIAAWFILDKKPTGIRVTRTVQRKSTGKGWYHAAVDDDNDKKVEVKAKVWQAGEPPRQAFFDIRRQFRSIEERLRKVEKYVTSKEYQLNHEISKL